MSEKQEAKVILRTAGFDARFPNQNQTKNCYTNYVGYFKCLKKKDHQQCKEFKRLYNELCPLDWIEKWDEQRAQGVSPHKLD